MVVNLFVALSMLVLPGQITGQEVTKSAQDELPTIRKGGLTLVAGQDSRRSRGRRGRPKARGGAYTAKTVENGGTIKGLVVYNGDVPKPGKIQIVKDQEVCNERDKIQHKIRIDDQKHVADVVVFLGDIKTGKPPVAPDEKHTVDQETCTFVPHVQVVMKDEAFDVVNKDPVAHNLHCTQKRVTLFNPIQPKQGMRSEFTIRDSGLATLRCDIHNWMRAYLYVLWHPYYDLTEADGVFELTDVPPGEYELVAWQEYLGETTMTVTVEPGKVSEIELELTKG